MKKVLWKLKQKHKQLLLIITGLEDGIVWNIL